MVWFPASCWLYVVSDSVIVQAKSRHVRRKMCCTHPYTHSSVKRSCKTMGRKSIDSQHLTVINKFQQRKCTVLTDNEQQTANKRENTLTAASNTLNLQLYLISFPVGNCSSSDINTPKSKICISVLIQSPVTLLNIYHHVINLTIDWF